MIDYFKFYFLNGAAFLKHYKDKILPSTVLLLISGLARLVEDVEYDREPMGYIILKVLQYGPVIIVIIILLLELISTFINFFINKPDVLVKKMMLDGYYIGGNNYSLIIRNYCRNVGNTSIRELLGIREGYYQEPTDLSASAAMLGDDSSSIIVISEQPTFYKQTHTAGGRNVTVYKYSWNVQFNPPVDIKTDFDYVVKLNANSVEQNAYDSSGTIFSYLVYLATQEMIITIHSQSGYIIKLLSCTVNDEHGNEVKKEKRKLLKPKLIALGTVLQWRVILPKKHLRYNLRYKLEPIL